MPHARPIHVPLSRRAHHPLEDLIPPDHVYRHLETKLDLSFVCDWAQELYAERGRPSIDFDRRTPYYGASRFTYDAQRDAYRCPQGQPLPRWKTKYTEAEVLSRADPVS